MKSRLQRRFNTLLLLGTCSVMLLQLTACEPERSGFGLDLIPEGERLHLRMAHERDFVTWSDTTTPGVTSSFSTAPIGEVYDDIFGISNSTVLAELYPNSAEGVRFSEAEVLDSAFFTLQLEKSFYDKALHIKVFALDTVLSIRAAALAKKDFSGKTLIAEGELAGDSDRIRFPLDVAWAREFMLTSAKKVGDPLGWPLVFSGIRVVAERVDASAEGRMVLFNVGRVENGVQFYWRQADTARSLSLQFFRDSKRFFRVTHDIAGTKLAGVVGLDRERQNASEKLYVAEYGGGRAGIDLTRIRERWKDSLPLVVNRAELRIPLSLANAPLGDTLITRLKGLIINGEDEFSLPESELEGEFVGGFYQRARGYFSINLTLTIQNLLKGTLPDNCLYLEAENGNFGIGRMVLSNGLASDSPMELIITYTKF